MRPFHKLSAFLIASLLFLSSTGRAQALYVQPTQGPPSSVLHYEPVEPTIRTFSAPSETIQPGSVQDQLEVSLSAFGKQFDECFVDPARNVGSAATRALLANRLGFNHLHRIGQC